jgi:hypothetical protein
MQYSQEIQGISYMGIYFIFQYGIWMDFKCIMEIPIHCPMDFYI